MIDQPSSASDSALEAAYREHAAALKRVAFLITGSNTTAEDAVQEVFTKCASRLPEIDHPLSYLRAAVVNECRTQHRKHGRTQTVQDPPAGSEELPLEILETLDALQVLDDRKRAAVVLRYFVDIPDEEIANILGCRPATVRSLIRRAVIELREALQ